MVIYRIRMSIRHQLSCHSSLKLPRMHQAARIQRRKPPVTISCVRLRTYGFPTIVTNCSNNYGPYHFPEKLIPLVILNALDGKALPIYGNGDQIRDWLYVEDHARALYTVVTQRETRGNVQYWQP